MRKRIRAHASWSESFLYWKGFNFLPSSSPQFLLCVCAKDTSHVLCVSSKCLRQCLLEPVGQLKRCLGHVWDWLIWHEWLGVVAVAVVYGQWPSGIEFFIQKILGLLWFLSCEEALKRAKRAELWATKVFEAQKQYHLSKVAGLQEIMTEPYCWILDLIQASTRKYVSAEKAQAAAARTRMALEARWEQSSLGIEFASFNFARTLARPRAEMVHPFLHFQGVTPRTHTVMRAQKNVNLNKTIAQYNLIVSLPHKFCRIYF